MAINKKWVKVWHMNSPTNTDTRRGLARKGNFFWGGRKEVLKKVGGNKLEKRCARDSLWAVPRWHAGTGWWRAKWQHGPAWAAARAWFTHDSSYYYFYSISISTHGRGLRRESSVTSGGWVAFPGWKWGPRNVSSSGLFLPSGRVMKSGSVWELTKDNK